MRPRPPSGSRHRGRGELEFGGSGRGLAFLSSPIGLVALLPDALPALVCLGTPGITGVTLDTTTSLVAWRGLGVAADDTTHFPARFGTFAERLADETKEIRKALWTARRLATS